MHLPEWKGEQIFIMSKETKAERNARYGRLLVRIFVDILCIAISMGGALWVRMDFHFGAIDAVFLESVARYMPINLCCTLVLFQLFHLYSSLWQFASVNELKNITAAVAASAAVQYAGMYLMGCSMPRSFVVLYPLLLFVLTVGSRFSYRFLLEARTALSERREDHAVPTMIVGAGDAGHMLLSEIISSQRVSRKVVCLVDDDLTKVGKYLNGVPIAGTVAQIPVLAEQYHVGEIIVAMPSVSGAQRKRILEICSNTSCRVMTLPGLYQIINGEVRVSMLRKVEIEDLLEREPVQLRIDKIMDYVSGKVILVTGGGGSIGSEICRQLAIHNPKKLIILDIYENNAYEIRGELMKQYPELDLEVLIGSVRNQKRIDTIFETYHPELVFHAAAHKHVPLMEDSPNEAIKNNVLGTWIVAQAADRYHAKKMVLISTDKAVRPTNVMGASKRICELIIQSFSQISRTEFAAVRFGNVLGSNGSVVPLFRKQIEAGGPVTVTHPEIIRYFMTIPEAVNLVLQCGALARGGEIFILDMGEPVKILDLAKRMIRLSGLEPGQDIPIIFTGLRPGEKLYEELLISLENLKETENKQIFVVQQPKVDEAWVQAQVQQLVKDAFAESANIRKEIQQLVPEYMPKGDTEAVSETMPKGEPEAAPETMPKGEPETAPETMATV